MKLLEKRVPLADLYLDPNNPRFADIGMRYEVPTANVHETSVQQKAEERMSDDKFEVDGLRDSIARNGYLPVDRMVATELPGGNGFLVVEGNRRLAALRILVREDAAHEASITPEVRASLSEIPILVIEDDDPALVEYKARLLQGVRHLSSFKQWGPYQQAQLVARMLDEGESVADIKEALGMSAQRITSLRRVYLAPAQMRKDPVYGSLAKPSLFSQFEEALKLPDVRKWLGWSDEHGITDETRSQLLYDWFVGIEEDGERLDPKIVDAKDIRRLPAVLASSKHLAGFVEDPRLKLRDVRIEQQTPAIDWRAILQGNLEIVKTIPSWELGHATSDDVQVLTDVRDVSDELLRQIAAIGAGGTPE